MPLETLIAESEGVPLRIHRAAGELGAGGGGRAARRDRRPGGGRSQRACARPRPRSPGGVVDLQTARERTRLYAVDEPPDPSEPEVCPFRGLAPFDAAHAEYFFGRERLVAELVARLVGSTLLAVVGPSGSGKSSAVRAGLLPALADGVVPGSERWRQAVMRPGERPLAELSRTLARRGARGGARGRRAVDRRRARAAAAPASAWCSSSISSRRSSSPAATRPSARRSSTRWSRAPADPDERLVVVLAIRGRLLRALRRARRALDAGQRQPGPGRADAPRRAAPGDRAARPQGGPAGRAAAGLGAGRRRRRRARRPAAALGRPARALAAARAAAPCATRSTSAAAASRARSRASPRTPTSA